MLQRSKAVLILSIALLTSAQARADALCDTSGNLMVYRGVDSCPSGSSRVDLSQFVKFKKGPVGPIGLKGPVGPAGVKGKTGPAGNRGANGDAGAKGLVGPKGDTGNQGARGPTGDKGPKGPKGLTGPAGDKGSKGDGGGTIGPKGNPGPAGDEPGSQGPRGPAGVAGQTGHSLKWREAVVPQVCQEKSASGLVNDGTVYDVNTKNNSIQINCNADQYLYQYTFSATGKLGTVVTPLTIAPEVTFVNGYNYVDRIQANFTLKLVNAQWESANYNAQLICCKTNPSPQ